MNQELEQIFSHPDFIELVIELIGEPLGERVSPLPIKETNLYPHFFDWSTVAIIDTWRSIQPDAESPSTSL
jgi:hypothetical protein